MQAYAVLKAVHCMDGHVLCLQLTQRCAIRLQAAGQQCLSCHGLHVQAYPFANTHLQLVLLSKSTWPPLDKKGGGNTESF